MTNTPPTQPQPVPTPTPTPTQSSSKKPLIFILIAVVGFICALVCMLIFVVVIAAGGEDDTGRSTNPIGNDPFELQPTEVVDDNGETKEIVPLKQAGLIILDKPAGYEVFTNAPDSIVIGNKTNANAFIITSEYVYPSTFTELSTTECAKYNKPFFEGTFGEGSSYMSTTYGTKGDMDYCLVIGKPGTVGNENIIRPTELYIVKRKDVPVLFHISSHKSASDSVIDYPFDYIELSDY